MSKKRFQTRIAGLLIATSAIATVPIVQAAEIFTVEDLTGTP